MGLFSDVGRTFEKTKQALARNKESEYVCGSCERSVDDAYDHCPHCGEESVEPVA